MNLSVSISIPDFGISLPAFLVSYTDHLKCNVSCCTLKFNLFYLVRLKLLNTTTRENAALLSLNTCKIGSRQMTSLQCSHFVTEYLNLFIAAPSSDRTLQIMSASQGWLKHVVMYVAPKVVSSSQWRQGIRF